MEIEPQVQIEGAEEKAHLERTERVDTDLLQTRTQEREELLQRAVKALQADARVVAAWLAGSLGRGTEDALSDLDLWVVISDAYYSFVSGRTREFAGKLGDPLLILEALQNAPTGGAYLLTLYPGETGPHQIDWYWQPQSHACLPSDARVLFDRAGLPAQPPLTADQRAQCVTQRILFFWAMLPIAAKKIARGNVWDAMQMSRMVANTLSEVQEQIGDESNRIGLESASLLGAREQLERLRQMARRMESLAPQAVALGSQVPVDVAPQVHRFLDLIETLVDGPSSPGPLSLKGRGGDSSL